MPRRVTDTVTMMVPSGFRFTRFESQQTVIPGPIRPHAMVHRHPFRAK